MSKSKNRLIPELRFPEYVKEGEWIEKTLGECLLKSPEYGINAPAVPYSENLPTYLRITDISEDGHFQQYEKVSVDRGVTENNYLVEDDIVLARTGASVGKSYKYRKKDGRLVFAGFLIRVSPNIKKLNSELLFQFLSTRQYWKWVSFISARSGQPGINGTEYSSMPIIIPPTIEEQQKIASCLSSLDELIAANSQKLEFLKEHKKGLMQNLFPQEGETVPKWRFKEFVKDGEWIKSKLGKLGQFLGGGTPERSNSSYWVGNIPWISSSDINEDDIHNISITRFINDQAIKMSATKIVPKGSVLFVSRVGVGKLAISTHELCTSQDFTNFIPKTISNYFIGYYFSANKHLLQLLNQGTSIKGFSKGDLENFELIYPENKSEQQKIASCLASLDELITAHAEKTDQLKLHKKGLMQGLFPKIIE
jgi:type I restriction enzyme S subunit